MIAGQRAMTSAAQQWSQCSTVRRVTGGVSASGATLYLSVVRDWIEQCRPLSPRDVVTVVLDSTVDDRSKRRPRCLACIIYLIITTECVALIAVIIGPRAF